MCFTEYLIDQYGKYSPNFSNKKYDEDFLYNDKCLTGFNIKFL